MKFTQSLIATALATILVTGCSEPGTPASTSDNATAEVASATPAQSESEKANQLFEDIFMASVMRSPMFQTYLGIKKDYDKWNDISEANTDKELAFTKADLKSLNALDTSALDEQTLLSYQLLKQRLEDEIADDKWRHYNYPVNQMRGLHAQIPAFLINQHSIANVDEANAYIARLNGADELLAQVVENLKIREAKGIIAPKFVFAYVISDSQNILKGAPFTDGEASTLLADFSRKVNKLDIDQVEKDTLIAQANEALLQSIKPGYEQLISYVTELETKADTRDGVWKFDQGEAFYNNALARTTTTDKTAEEIHQIGLSEVARIHDEMREIMKKVKFDGDLKAFMEYMRTSKEFYYPDTEAGREEYLTKATALIDNMKSRLDELFIIKPKADLEVKRVESFREKSAGKAFYQQPAPDGSRPGKYYANLYKMDAMPTYQMEALAYHEGIPGHHMQIAIGQELENIPKFRKFGGYTAYVEGWGLYSEFVPKEIGLYEDPYSDFGRLAMELWRACRLVVDTGIHAKQWNREQGIAYYMDNTPNAESDAIKMVERHVVMPSQATAYKIGMLKIVELRDKAKTQLADKFDIREFHDVILKNGAVPLNVLETMVDNYIDSKQA